MLFYVSTQSTDSANDADAEIDRRLGKSKFQNTNNESTKQSRQLVRKLLSRKIQSLKLPLLFQQDK